MKKLLMLMACAIMIAIAACQRPGGEYREIEGGVWHTVYHIVYRSDNSLDDSIVAVMRQVEMSLSPFVDSSLVSRVNRGDTVVADSLMRRVMARSIDVNRWSGGAFDPTVGPLTNLWGFGYKNLGREPSAAEIDSVLRSVGIAGCGINPDGTVRRKTSDTQFNFSAITKGMGCDLIGEMLRRNGVEDYMIEIGGEIAMHGVNRRGEPWRVQVDAPVEDDSTVIHQRMLVIAPGDGGVATSGNYRNFHDTSRGRVGHTISPSTGYPVKTSTLSATVVAPDCMTADALATACMVMPPADALQMIERLPRVEALIVTSDSTASSGMKMLRTGGFKTI